ncbi:MAG: hypothetical protein ACRD2O_13440 [Terriglobia bacterium]
MAAIEQGVAQAVLGRKPSIMKNPAYALRWREMIEAPARPGKREGKNGHT